MIRESYRCAYAFEKRYPIYDQIAVATALYPEIVLAYEEKQCRVLDENDSTRGMVITNWLD